MPNKPLFSVFCANLQTDMGKTIVRRHLTTTDAQTVWRELSEHMRISSKGASEKRRLSQHVTNTVLDDMSIIYIIDQSTSFIEYFMQDNIKYPKIKKFH